jgi:hypothetical protein
MGFISGKGIEVLLSKGGSIGIDESLLGRMLGHGSVKICSHCLTQ